MTRGERRTHPTSQVINPQGKTPKKAASERLRQLWPDIWEMVRPRRGILSLGLLLIIIRSLAGFVLPSSTRYLIDNVLNKHQSGLLLPLTLAVVGATIIQGITSFSLTQLLSIEGQKLIAQLRGKVQEHIGRLPVTYFDSNKTGQLVSRIMSDVEGMRNLVGTGVIEFIGGLLTAGIGLFLALRISPMMTVVAIAVVLTFGSVLSKAFKTVRPIFRERGKINAEVTGRLTESLGGVRVIKGYHAEDREAGVFAAGVQRLLDNVRRSLTAMSLMSLSATVLMGVVGALIMYLGTHEVYAGKLTVGELVTLQRLPDLSDCPDHRHRKYRDADERSAGGPGAHAGSAAGAAGGRGSRTHRGDWPDRGSSGVPGCGVRLRSRLAPFCMASLLMQSRALLPLSSGPSGSGKSTTIGLIAAFHKTVGGRILVDGVDLDTVRLPSYRTQLGVVLQETFLFDGSIRENVMFSRPGATEAEMLEACRIARVDEFAEVLEQGYDTIVGERGVKLSGGQRQRLSIARAILADPRILILDEATSSLDSESEAMIQQGLAHLMRGRTTFVIAHRLSTIRRADQILVIEDGRIVERGTHPELYAMRGRYWDMYTRQHALDDNLFLAPGEGDVVPEAEVAAGPAREGAGGALSVPRGL